MNDLDVAVLKCWMNCKIRHNNYPYFVKLAKVAESWSRWVFECLLKPKGGSETSGC